jgi:hypothetical protein
MQRILKVIFAFLTLNLAFAMLAANAVRGATIAEIAAKVKSLKHKEKLDFLVRGAQAEGELVYYGTLPIDGFLSDEAQAFLTTTLGKGSAMKGVRSKYKEFQLQPDFVVTPKLGPELKELEPAKWETVHGGYNTAFMNQNPHYGVPLDALRALEAEGAIGPGKLYPAYYVIPGNQGSPEVMCRVGQEIAADLKKDNVEGVLFVAT